MASLVIPENSNVDEDSLGLDSGPLGSHNSLFDSQSFGRASKSSINTGNTDNKSSHNHRTRTDLEIFLWAYGLSEYRIRQAHDPDRFAAMDVVGFEERKPGTCGDWRPFFVFFVNGAVFQNATFALIIFNAVFMGMQANAAVGVSRGEPHNETPFMVIDSLFVVGFLLEICLRIAGRTHRISHDTLLLSDIFVVAISALESWVVGPVSSDGSSNQLAMLSVFRLVRILKITKLFRVLGFAKPLQLLTRCLISCTHNAVCVIAVLGFVVFGWSIVIVLMLGPSTDAFSELPFDLQSRFSSVLAGVLTMTEVALNGDMWGSLLFRPLFEASGFNSSIACLALVGYTCCMHLWLIALVTGIFIEQTFIESDRLAQRADEDQIMRGQFGIRSLKAIFKTMDTNEDSDLSWSEFEAGLAGHPQLMKKLDLTMKTAKFLYRELAIDAYGTVSLDDFLFGIIRHTQRTKSIDMVTIDFDQQRTLTDLRTLGLRCSTDMVRLTHHLDRSLLNVSSVRTDVEALTGRIESQLQTVHGMGAGTARSSFHASTSGLPDVCITPGGNAIAEIDRLPTPRDRGREVLSLLEAQLRRIEQTADVVSSTPDPSAWRRFADGQGRSKIRAAFSTLAWFWDTRRIGNSSHFPCCICFSSS